MSQENICQTLILDILLISHRSNFKDLKHQSSTTTVLAISFLTHLKNSNQRYQMVFYIYHTYLITSPCSSLALLLTRSTQFSRVGT